MKIRTIQKTNWRENQACVYLSVKAGRQEGWMDRLLFSGLEGWVLGDLDSGPCLPDPEQCAFPLFVSVSMFTKW